MKSTSMIKKLKTETPQNDIPLGKTNAKINHDGVAPGITGVTLRVIEVKQSGPDDG